MSWLLDYHNLPVSGLEFRAALNQESTILLHCAAPAGNMEPLAMVSLLNDQETIIKNLVVTNVSGTVIGATHPVVRNACSPVLKVFQRTPSESLEEFLNRWFVDGALSFNGGDGDPKDLAKVLKPGGTLTQMPGDSALSRWAKARSLLASQSSTFLGWSRGLDPRWRWITFHPGATDPNWYANLEAKHWRLESGPAVGANDQGTLTLTASAELKKGEFASLLKSIQQNRKATMEGITFSTLPTTIKINTQWFFCVAVEFRINFTHVPSQSNTFVKLTLTPDRPLLDHKLGSETARHLVAQFQSWSPQSSSVELAPASMEQMREAGMENFPEWQLSQDGNLLAKMLTPGFARTEYSSHYARLKKGDILIVRVEDGEQPLVLGAPQRRQEQFERVDGPELTLSGTTVLARSVQNDGTSEETSLMLNQQGKVSLTAKKEASILDKVLITKNETKFAQSVAIEGNLKID